MKKLGFFVFAVAIAMSSVAQSITVYEEDTPVGFNISDVDSIIFSPNGADNPRYMMGEALVVDGHWQSLGTSITWYNNNVSFAGGAFTKGYQDRVMEKLAFSKFTNSGVNGGVLASAIGQVQKADYYTIEHGINDWGHSTKVGTIDDYKNDTKNGTFAANYRQLIDAIYKANPKAMVVLCTPRKAYGFGDYLPAHWYDAKNGIYLQEYADLVKQIASYESLPVADFFYECGNQHNLAQLSIDVALHPNDPGYQLMANVLVEALQKVLLP